ncbi:hypothetical protein BJ322DRAFT_1023488 [Thelephora terrestris]|uniref:F-box domain-containing protein n=1 Tax=Thelephora terrestris TaxID=56493 RepID=A0A9P6L396_9AGAM|nr:hypothetical protein BJ322DRAFT_1023488 [Thelephora terrestris]
MSIFVDDGEFYPGISLSVSELLDATKRKLRSSMFGERISALVSQVDRLERDALEVLRMIHSVRNTLAPIHRIPPEIFSLIPQYWSEGYTDKDLVALTHVCQRWREVFIAYPPLWTYLECKNVAKTRVYIDRSKSSPLQISLHDYGGSHYYLKDAFVLVIPHIKRVMSINLAGGNNLFQDLTKHFSCPVPLLRRLNLNLTCTTPLVLDSTLFYGDVSSLRTLTMTRVVPHLPWKNLPQLTTLTVSSLDPAQDVLASQLLDIFSSAPLLSKVELHTIPKSSDAPPGRVMSLPCLKSFTIVTKLVRTSTFLNHLSIPAGALLHLEFVFCGFSSPLPRILPETPENLQNLLHITSACLRFHRKIVTIRLDGPSGGLLMHDNRITDRPNENLVDSEKSTLWSLEYFDVSKIQRLAVTMYGYSLRHRHDESIYHVLNMMGDLHTLFLNQCNSLLFILALNPDKNPPKLVLCPNLEKLVFWDRYQQLFYIREMTDMAKKRALKGAKLRSITLISQAERVLEREVFELREYVEHVECRFQTGLPEWDRIF